MAQVKNALYVCDIKICFLHSRDSWWICIKRADNTYNNVKLFIKYIDVDIDGENESKF